MGRLIDADILLAKVIEANPMGGVIGGKFIEDLIKGEPTAYDVDKVVERLQNDCHNYYPSIDCCCMSQKVVKLNDAIKIVKEGAVKDE